ncbi:DUF3563 domain-containing protein [Alphaproteobacteria bacterium]|nr:DUF3563 domain-containing protein [Alphaproteobacteria bacterium]MDB2636323.1 DUF3563 domain-containing protein [Alphaproteobacteria bacterium]MDB3973932.1 DUF3563 domain-containing protein [Alphaproteobacteria bacterium]
MSGLFKTLRQVVRKATVNNYDDQKKQETYLAQSTDLFDLERRQKEIDSRFTRKL